MDSPPRGEDDDSLTKRLRRFMKGDVTLVDSLVREIMPELYRIAAGHIRKERYMAPLQTSDLVNEFWLKYLKGAGFEIKDQAHFYVLVSRMMRQVLVDLAKKRLAGKRNNGEAPLWLEDFGGFVSDRTRDDSQMLEIVEIGRLMDELEVEAPDAAAIVDMHHFVGFDLKEIAGKTGLTDRQVRRRWENGRKWLGRRLPKAV